MRKLVIGVGGSSGAIYTKVLFDRLSSLRSQVADIGVVMSKNARYNWKLEVKNAQPEDYDFDFYDGMDFHAPFASGSAKYDTMIVCPVSQMIW